MKPPTQDGPEQRASSAGAIAERTARGEMRSRQRGADTTPRSGPPQGGPTRQGHTILAVRGCHVMIATCDSCLKASADGPPPGARHSENLPEPTRRPVACWARRARRGWRPPRRACDRHACTRASAVDPASRNASTADSRNRSTFDANRIPTSSPARYRRNTVSGEKPR